MSGSEGLSVCEVLEDLSDRAFRDYQEPSDRQHPSGYSRFGGKSCSRVRLTANWILTVFLTKY